MAEDKFIDIGELKFHYLDWGGRGDWVVLLHGLASQAHIWDLVAPHLNAAFRVIALDQRGHGLSDKPDHGYDFASVTRDLDRVLGALKIERTVLVGHSWGGNVALQYAVDHPQRVSGLVLVDGGFLEIGDRMGWPQTEQLLEPPDLIGMPYEELRENMKRWMGSAWSPEAAAITLQNFEVRTDGTVAPHMRKRNHMQVVHAIWEHRPSQLWTQVQCPALMIPAVGPTPHDERTQAFIEAKQRNIARAEQLLARSQTIWMTDTIHDIPLQRPRELAQAIRDFVTGKMIA